MANVYILLSLLFTLRHACSFNTQFRRSSFKPTDRRLYATSIMSASSAKPVPKVPASAWKWPQIWPFPADFMEVISDESKYNSTISFTATQTAAFQNHISYFVQPSTSLLEIGAQQGSVLPIGAQNFQGTNVKYLALTDNALRGMSTTKWAVNDDSDKVVLPYSDAMFDTIIVSSGIESFTNPRDVFREIWRVLKPNGKCIVCFAGKPNIDGLQPVKMWTTMTNEQKIWIVGSYYQYSAFEGWVDIEGFDALGISGTKEMVFDMSNKTDETAFVVQASKYETPTVENSGSVTAYFARLMVSSQHMGLEAKSYNSLRLAADYSNATSDAEKHKIVESVPQLDSIYNILKDISDSVIPPPVKAMLANYIIYDWKNTPVQVGALRKGLGLDTADEYWKVLGAHSSALAPKAKIQLLGELVRAFGVNQRVSNVPSLMGSILEILRPRYPDVEEKNLQAFTAELILSDYLHTTSPPDRLIRYVTIGDADRIRQQLEVKNANIG